MLPVEGGTRWLRHEILLSKFFAGGSTAGCDCVEVLRALAAVRKCKPEGPSLTIILCTSCCFVLRAASVYEGRRDSKSFFSTPIYAVEHCSITDTQLRFDLRQDKASPVFRSSVPPLSMSGFGPASGSIGIYSDHSHSTCETPPSPSSFVCI